MRASGTCPKCACTTLLHIRHVAANTDTGTSQVQPTFRLAVNGLGWEGATGELEAYACSQCGLVEMYLAQRLPVDGQYVREVKKTAPAPYR